jgi:uracil-DNA glycosylase
MSVRDSMRQTDLGFEPAAREKSVPRLHAWQPEEWPVAPGWREVIREFLGSEAGQRLGAFIRARLAQGATIYPPQPFRALEHSAPGEVKLVILGQDPYHGPGQAEGLAFSVGKGVKLPPSLRNIFKERQRLFGTAIPADGSLQAWAAQGILLLNTSLTVEDGQAASHARQGWETLTDALLEAVASRASPCVYLLWGAHAQAKAGLIEQAAARQGREALILQSNHPSPLSASRPPVPFLGSGHLAVAREWLATRGHCITF